MSDVLIVGLAAGYCVIAWRDASLFAERIAWLEDGMLTEYGRRLGRFVDNKFSRGRVLGKNETRAASIGQWFTTLLLCPFCLVAHVCFWLWLGIDLFRLTLGPATLLNTLASGTVAWATYKHFTLRPPRATAPHLPTERPQ